MLDDDLENAPERERSYKETELRSLLDRGIAAARSGQRDRARRYLERALEVDSGNEEAWLWLASITEDRGLAGAIYERLLEVYPDSVRARQSLVALNEAEAITWEPKEPETNPEAEAVEAVLEEIPAKEEPIAPADGEQDGPSLFIPPWEVGVTIPVFGKALPPGPMACEAAKRCDSDEGIGSTDEGALQGQEERAFALLQKSCVGEVTRSGEAAATEMTIGGEDASPGVLRQTDVVEEPIDDVSPESLQPEPEVAGTLPSSPDNKVVSVEHLGAKERSNEELQDTMDPFPSHKEADSTVIPPAKLLRNGAMFVMLLFVLAGSLALIFLVASESRADRLRYALGMVTNTPTVTLTPTCTFTPVPTSTPSCTPTLTPSPTPTCTATSVPSATPTRSWVSERYLPLPEEEKWIEVDLSDQTLIAYDGTKVVYTALISSGKGYTPTVKGKFRIKRKLESQLMTGPGYYLPNVPHVMYFYARYALHGAYWHDKWGTPTSHGCVNLKLEDAEWLYAWADPKVPAGAKSVSASKESPGTWVLIHD